MIIKKFEEINEFYDAIGISDIEGKLVDFFQLIKDDRQWVVDRFNDEETKNFIEYLINLK